MKRKKQHPVKREKSGINEKIDSKEFEVNQIQSDEIYRLIFETANEGIWITDKDRKTTDCGKAWW